MSLPSDEELDRAAAANIGGTPQERPARAPMYPWRPEMLRDINWGRKREWDTLLGLLGDRQTGLSLTTRALQARIEGARNEFLDYGVDPATVAWFLLGVTAETIAELELEDERDKQAVAAGVMVNKHIRITLRSRNPIEVRWEITPPDRWWQRWSGLISYRLPPDNATDVASPWMEYAMHASGMNLGYTVKAWSGEKLEEKLHDAEQAMIDY